MYLTPNPGKRGPPVDPKAMAVVEEGASTETETAATDPLQVRTPTCVQLEDALLEVHFLHFVRYDAQAMSAVAAGMDSFKL